MYDEYIWPDDADGVIGDGEEKVAKKLVSIHVKQDDEINFNLSYDKHISDIDAVEVIKDGYDGSFGETRDTKPLQINKSKIKVTQDKGEHIYSLFVTWGPKNHSSHRIKYVIKINVI